MVIRRQRPWRRHKGAGKQSLAAALGVGFGFTLMIVLVGAGLAKVFEIYPIAHTILKYASCAYLVWLAWQAFTAPVDNGTDGTPPDLGGRAMFGRGVLMNLTNPKVGIFFLAFLPQFVKPESGPVPLQVVQLGGLFVVATLLLLAGISWIASLIGGWLRGKALLQILLEAAFEGLSDEGWMKLSRNWGIFFLILAGVNEGLRHWLWGLHFANFCPVFPI